MKSRSSKLQSAPPIKKYCPFSYKGAPKIDYRNIKLLTRFITEKGKIMPSRITNVSSQKQKKLAKAIKRARYLGFLSYIEKKYRSRN